MDSPSPATAPARTTPSSTGHMTVREDCWNEDATHTLVEAWGERYLELNRGNLRQKHWQEVADAVNDRHGHNWKQLRTDIQCKNRIDTLKKKYKIEKGRVSGSNGVYTGQWPFFARLDALIGENFPAAKKPLQPISRPRRKTTQPTWAFSSPVPVAPRSGTQKRPAPANSPAMAPVDDSYFRRKLSVFAAAAAAAAEEEEEEEEEEGDNKEDSEEGSGSGSGSRSRSSQGNRRTDRIGEEEGERELGHRALARAIEKFGEIYERVEEAKQRKIFELEKQRMQFVKDLEYQRMQLFMETHVELQKMKRTKNSSAAANNYT